MNTATDDKSITLADLDALRRVIEIGCIRGAFRADEIKEIGELYNKLKDFLEVTAIQTRTTAETEISKQGD